MVVIFPGTNRSVLNNLQKKTVSLKMLMYKNWTKIMSEKTAKLF